MTTNRTMTGLLALLVAGFAQGLAADEEGYPWKAAAVSTAITPDSPVWMAGYSSRNRPSEPASQDLYAKVLALEDAERNRFVIVTTDLVGITEPMRKAVQQQALERFDLPAAGLLMNASHTHSGPEVRIGRLRLEERPPEWIERAEQYVRKTNEHILAAIGRALTELEPARVSFTSARCGFAMNRRLVTDRGVRGGPNPGGPVDHSVPVLRVDSPDGKELRAAVFGYACHNTVLGLFDLNGDYAGWTQHYLEEAHPNMTALFVMGCGGDQNPYPRRTRALAQQHGRTLSNAVEAALEAKSKPLAGPLRTALETTSLSFAEGPSRAELLKQTESGNKAQQRHARLLLSQLESGDGFIKEYAYPVQMARFGDGMTLVGLAGEAVVDYSLRLKRELAGPNTWVAGYCNALPTYIPSLRVLREGGYEGGDHRRYTSFSAPFAESIEERIIGKVLQLNEQLGGQKAEY